MDLAFERVANVLSRRWWLFLLDGVVGIIFGILALVWPAITLLVLIRLFGLLALFSGIVGVFSSIGSAGTRRPWGWQLATGLLGILIGLVILRWPGETALILLALVGVWAIGSGIIKIVSAFADHEVIPNAWLFALSGVISVLFGIAMFAWPAVGLLTLVYLVGIYAIVFGIIDCVIAFQVRSLPERVATGPAMAT